MIFSLELSMMCVHVPREAAAMNILIVAGFRSMDSGGGLVK